MSKKPLIIRLWKFQFPLIDLRLSTLAGVGATKIRKDMRNKGEL
jgi:hypothetical protein